MLATPAAAAERVASLGGAVTEIFVALGQEHWLVARDAAPMMDRGGGHSVAEDELFSSTGFF